MLVFKISFLPKGLRPNPSPPTCLSSRPAWVGFAYNRNFRIYLERQEPNRGKIKLFKTHTTFHRSFEEYFAAPTSQDPVMTPWGFVRAHKAEFGRWSRCRGGAGWRRADIWSHSRAKEGRKQRHDLTVMTAQEISKSTCLTSSLPSAHVHTGFMG